MKANITDDDIRLAKAALSAGIAEITDGLFDELLRAASENRQLDDRVAELERERTEMLASDTPWPLTSVLEQLLAAVEHGLSAHDCDHHGWELDQGAVAGARALVARLTARKASP